MAKTLAENGGGAVRLLLTDVVEPSVPPGAHTIALKADLTDVDEVRRLFGTKLGVPDTIYCMHGIMSRGAEDSFDLGLKVLPAQ